MPALNEKHIAKARRAVRETYPELAGAEPKVITRKTQSKGKGCPKTVHVVSFSKRISLPGGGHMTRAVRVTMDQMGEIVKISSSK